MRSMLPPSTLLLALVLPCGASAQMLGVLEQPPCKPAEDRAVRPLFVKQGKAWKSLQDGLALEDYPSHWRAIDTADAQSIEVQPPATKPQPEWTFARDFVLQPVPGQALPEQANTDRHFAGWCDAPTLAPVMLLAGADNVIARPAERVAAPDALDRVFRRMRRPEAGLKLCAGDAAGRPAELLIEHLRFAEALVLPGGGQLVAVKISPALVQCESELGGPLPTHWYLLKDQSAPRLIGKEMTHLGSADLDADGRYEHVFWFTGDNQDGYLLFDDNFGAPLRFEWSYH
jgi:hypothetical protein